MQLVSRVYHVVQHKKKFREGKGRIERKDVRGGKGGGVSE